MPLQTDNRLGEKGQAARGVDVRVILSADATTDRRRYRELVEVAIAMRVLERPAMKLMLRDGAEAIIALRDPVTGELGVTSAVIRHPDLVRVLELHFGKEWRRAKPFAPAGA